MSAPATPAASLWAMMGMEPKRSYRLGGTEYPTREPTLEEQHKFCQWLASNALQKIEANAPFLSPATLKQHREIWQESAAAGKWAYLSPAYMGAVSEPDAQAKLVSIVLTADGHPECTHEFVREHLTKDFERTLVEALSDPKVLEQAGPLFRLLTGATETTAGPTPTPSPTPPTASPPASGL